MKQLSMEWGHAIPGFARGANPGNAEVHTLTALEAGEHAAVTPGQAGELIRHLALPVNDIKGAPEIQVSTQMEVRGDGRIYFAGQYVGSIAVCDDHARQFARVVNSMSRAIGELDTQRKCCREALDGTWDCSTTEGQEAFNDMEAALEGVLGAMGVRYEQ